MNARIHFNVVPLPGRNRKVGYALHERRYLIFDIKH